MLKSNRLAVEAEIAGRLKTKNEAAAIAVESEAKKLAPVDTGRLRASITNSSDETGAVIGTNLEYAPFVELGTSKQAPQPFLVPALMNAKPILRQIYGSGVGGG